MSEFSALQKLTAHLFDSRPNITCVFIGSAYSEHGGYQQFPPFLSKLYLQFANFSYQIILVDKFMEPIPKIVELCDLKKIDTDWYGKNNITVNVINENFDFDEFLFSERSDTILVPKSTPIVPNSTFITSKPVSTSHQTINPPINMIPKKFNKIGHVSVNSNSLTNCTVKTNFSKEFLKTLINRTIENKKNNSDKTFLLFVHDYSGHGIFDFSEKVFLEYKNSDKNTIEIYKKNILINLSTSKKHLGCFPDLTSPEMHPILFNDNDSLSIFNPSFIDEQDLIVFYGYKWNYSCIPEMIEPVIMSNLTKFVSNITSFRQTLMFIRGHGICIDMVPQYTKNIRTCDLMEIRKSDTRIHLFITDIKTQLLTELTSIISVFEFFKECCGKFDEFYSYCSGDISEPYKLLDVFNSCRKNLKLALDDLQNKNNGFLINNYIQHYVIINKSIPPILEMIMYDNTFVKSQTKSSAEVVEI